MHAHADTDDRLTCTYGSNVSLRARKQLTGNTYTQSVSQYEKFSHVATHTHTHTHTYNRVTFLYKANSTQTSFVATVALLAIVCVCVYDNGDDDDDDDECDCDKPHNTSCILH